MDAQSVFTSSGITAGIIGIIYAFYLLCRHRHVLCKSGCCMLDVGSGDTPPQIAQPHPVESSAEAFRPTVDTKT